jgi:hypothetical protein
MAKNSVTDYDTTAANNTDVGGIAIEGSDDVANFDNALRMIMSHAKEEQTSKQAAIDAIDATAIGLGNVNNTSDANKPVSTAQQTALDAKLSLSGGTMTGNIIATGINLGGAGAANLLDDYEEGTWTPTIAAGLTSITYTSQNGTYTKIGNYVFANVELATSAGTQNSAALQISGLPFTVDGQNSSGGWRYANNVVSSTTNSPPIIHPTATSIYFYFPNGGTFTGNSLVSGVVDIRLGIAYRAS